MKKTILALSLFILGQAAPLPAEVMTYQGRLKESNIPVSANRSFDFELCATETPTGCVPSVDGAKPFQVLNGLFKSTFTLPAVDFSAGPWYLRVKVEGVYLSPVERLTFVPYSVFASSSAYAGSASALGAVSGLGVVSSTHVIVLGGLNASDSGVQLSTVAVIEGYALLKNLNTGIEDVRVGVSGRVNSDSTDAVDILAGGNFEVEVPINRNGSMIGVRSAVRNSGSSALAVGLLVDSLSNSGTIGDTYGVWIATLTQGAQTNKPFALYSEDPNARSYFAGNVGISSRAPAYALSVSSAAGDLFWVADDGAHGAKFWGDGSGLTGVTGASGTDSTKVLKAGDTMTGSLLMDAGSTITVTGSAFSVGGATLVVRGGYVGIGTDTPANPLEVNAHSSQYILAGNSDTTDATINLVHASGGAARLNDNSAIGKIALSIGSADRLVVNNQGNVGIGAAVPAYRLVVSSGAGENGGIIAVSTGATNVFSVDGYGVTALKFTGDGSGLTGLSGAAAADTATNLAGGAIGAIPYQSAVNTTAMLPAGITGQVLVANTGSTPFWTGTPAFNGSNLTSLTAGSISAGSLPGTVIASSIAVQSITSENQIVSGAISNANLAGSITDSKLNTITTAGKVADSALSANVNLLDGNQTVSGIKTFTSSLTVAASDFSVGGSTLVTNAGRVGIGTENPGATLDIYGKISASYLEAHNTGNANKLLFRLSQWSNDGLLELLNASETYGISLNAAGTAPSYIVAGNVGIGTNVPEQKLTVAGNISQTGVLIASGTGNNYFAGNVGISTGVPEARLDVLAGGSALTDMAQIWRNSGGTIISSVSATGVVTAAKFVGDGSAITGLGSAAAAGTATNLAGGAQGEIPYQSGVSATAMLAAGSAGQLLQSGGGGGAAPGWTTPASANTASAIVKRDASGNFSAGMITANVTGALTGNADTVTNGVYDSTTYSDPVWIASLATSKIDLSTVTADIGLRVLRSGDTMTGQLTNTSSVTISGNGGGAYGLEVSSNVTMAGALYSANGNVGVGAASPAAKLDVYGPNTASFIEAHNTSNAGKKTLRISLWSNHGLLDVFNNAEATAIRLNADPTAPTFFNAGNVGIGVTSPLSRLEISGGSVTIHGQDTDVTVLKAGDNGIVISTGGAIQSTGVGHGSVAGNARGKGAVDLQVSRSAATQTASGESSVLSGGDANSATGPFAVVSGGQVNVAGATYASVSGGGANQATGYASAVHGGQGNLASASWASVSGNANTGSGNYSTVSGGSDNTALGVYSWAAGYRSSSTASGSFTWSDSQGTEVRNTTADRTVFKNKGGFLITSQTGVLPGNDAMLEVRSSGSASGFYAQVWRDSNGAVVASMTATGRLSGDGSGLTGVPAADATKLPLSGGRLTGWLEVGNNSTMTVTGNAFSADGTRLIVGNGMVGVNGNPLNGYYYGQNNAAGALFVGGNVTQRAGGVVWPMGLLVVEGTMTATATQAFMYGAIIRPTVDLTAGYANGATGLYVASPIQVGPNYAIDANTLQIGQPTPGNE